MTDNKIERADEAIKEAKKYTEEAVPEAGAAKGDPDTRDENENGPAEAVSNVADQFKTDDRDQQS